MEQNITILDNSRYRKDYNKFFSIGDHYGDSFEIRNRELSDKTFEELFQIINTIIVICPNSSNKIDGNLSYLIREEFKESYLEVKDFFKSEKLSIHSRELHNKSGANCKEAIHFSTFQNYHEIVQFLGWEELENSSILKVFTALKNEQEINTTSMTVNNNNIDNRVYKKVDKSKHIHNTNNVTTNGSRNKIEVGTNQKSSKNWFSKILGVFKGLLNN